MDRLARGSHLLAHLWDELDAKKCLALRQKGACLDRLNKSLVASGAACPSGLNWSVSPTQSGLITCGVPGSMLGLQKHPRIAECPPGESDMTQMVRTPDNRVTLTSTQRPPRR